MRLTHGSPRKFWFRRRRPEQDRRPGDTQDQQNAMSRCIKDAEPRREAGRGHWDQDVATEPP